MDPASIFAWATTPLQIVLVDLLLGADNALVIGLASRSLPLRERRRATAIGVGGAIVLRLLMTMVATSLLALPFIKLIGALMLMLIALNLDLDERTGLDEPATAEGDASRLWAAAAVIVVADAAMSLDNVVALAAIARGSFLWLLIGVGLSLPMLGYGGLLAAQWLHRAPGLIAFGAAMLGWIAGGMAVADPLWADWAEANAPGLTALAPVLGAAFVFLHGRWDPRAEEPARARLARPVARITPPPRETAPEGPSESRRVEERVVIVGVLLLAILAGAFIVIVSFFGGLE